MKDLSNILEFFSKTIELKLNRESGKDTNLMAIVVDNDGNGQQRLCHGWERENNLGRVFGVFNIFPEEICFRV